MPELHVVSHSGIYLCEEAYGLLIDGICADFGGFMGTSEAVLDQIRRREGMFRTLSMLLFSHLHPDHCDLSHLTPIRKALGCPCFLPGEDTPQSSILQCGPFSVRLLQVPHLQSRLAAPTALYTFFIKCRSGTSLYLMADAAPEPQCYGTLNRNPPDFVVTNPVTFFAPSMQPVWMRWHPKAIFIDHLPQDPKKQHEIRKKADRMSQRLPAGFPRVLFLSPEEHRQLIL